MIWKKGLLNLSSLFYEWNCLLLKENLHLLLYYK